MSAEHVPSTVCAAVGHEIVTVMVVRCRHTEAVWWSVSNYTELAQVPQLTGHAGGEVGPFDDEAYLRSRLWNDLQAALDAQMGR